MENRDKISRKEVLRLLKKDRFKAAGKTITISGVVYVPEEYVRNIIKATKGV